MPNYTRNLLIVRGAPECLKYFYERNRVTEDDIKYTSDGGDVRSLSFDKCVSRDITKVTNAYISKNYEPKKASMITIFDLSSSFIERDLMVSIWGTKWDAIDPIVNMNEVEDGKIEYSFLSAWNYPYNWLVTISQIFPSLTFEITYSNEDDGYDETYVEECKEGDLKEIRTYSAVEKSIEEVTLPELTNFLVSELNEKNVQMIDDDKKSLPWLAFSKAYLEKEKEKENYESDLLYEILSELDFFAHEYELHPQIYTHKGFAKAFADYIRSV